MSEAKRAYNLLRGYVNREWERIKGLEMLDALRELDSPLTDKQQKIQEKQGEAGASAEAVEDDTNYEATARTILNVHANASFEEIRKAFEKISRRSQPENFLEGSEESEHAQVLLRRATWAYNYLTKNVSASEKRFKSLEIE